MEEEEKKNLRELEAIFSLMRVLLSPDRTDPGKSKAED